MGVCERSAALSGSWVGVRPVDKWLSCKDSLSYALVLSREHGAVMVPHGASSHFGSEEAKKQPLRARILRSAMRPSRSTPGRTVAEAGQTF